MSEFEMVNESELQGVEGGVAFVPIAAAVGTGMLWGGLVGVIGFSVYWALK